MSTDVQSKSKTLHQCHRLVPGFFQTENIWEEFTFPFNKIEEKISIERTLLKNSFMLIILQRDSVRLSTN